MSYEVLVLKNLQFHTENTMQKARSCLKAEIERSNLVWECSHLSGNAATNSSYKVCSCKKSLVYHANASYMLITTSFSSRICQVAFF